MSESTKYWVQNVKRITLELDKAQKTKIRYTRLLGNTQEGSAQYKDIQSEIERLDKLIFERQRELLAIKCAALSSCKHFSRSAKKAGFVTNAGYKDYLVEQFMHNNQILYEGFSNKDVEDDLLAVLSNHVHSVHLINGLEREKRMESRYDYDGTIKYRDPQGIRGWITAEQYEEERTRDVLYPENFYMVMSQEEANVVERKSR